VPEVVVATPPPERLADVVAAMREWQHDGPPVPLHPGDLGWQHRQGPVATAAALRTWTRDGRLLAVGLVDSPEVLRLAVDPAVQDDDAFCRDLVGTLTGRDADVLVRDDARVEVRFGGALRGLLVEAGWSDDEPWTPLRLDLAEPVPDPGCRVDVVGPDLAGERVAVHRSTWPASTFTEDGWHAMAAGPAHAHARCLLVRDDEGRSVAATTVWSAGPGRPGLIEPLGVRAEHRGRGHGRAVTLAAAAALRELGASSVTVCTPSANTVGVAAYLSAGFERLPDTPDLRRPAPGS
jgi:ribosomal protein S18 acetylase RimI-like enzyme